MHIPTLALSLLAAAVSAAAAPGKSCPAPQPGTKFGVMALRSASPIHFATMSASRTKLVLNLPAQDAQCDGGADAEIGAVFYIRDGELYLYGRPDAPQQIYVDRSGMGQGNVGYFNKNEASPPRNAELKGWAIVGENLTFDGDGLLACPSTSGDGAWYVWAPVGIDKPAGLEGCLGFSGRAITLTDPARCTYSVSV